MIAAARQAEPRRGSSLDLLARLTALSGIPELRRATAHQRRCAAGLMLLCAAVRDGTMRLVYARTAKSLMIGSNDMRRSGFIDQESLSYRLSLPGAASRELFRGWLAAGLPGCPVVHVAALSPGLSPEDAFTRFVLLDAWRGQFPSAGDSSGVGEPLSLVDLRAFMRGLASADFAEFRAANPTSDPCEAAAMARRLGSGGTPRLRAHDADVARDYARFLETDPPGTAVEVATRISELQNAGVAIDLGMVLTARRAAPSRDWQETIRIIEELLRLAGKSRFVDMGTLPVILEKFPTLTSEQIVELCRDVSNLRAKGINTTAKTVVAARELFTDGPGALEALHVKAQDLHERLTSGPMAEQVRKAAELEPLVNHPRRNGDQVILPPRPLLDQVAGFRRLAHDLGHSPAKSVVLVNRCGMSGAARVAASLAHALAAIDDETSASDVVVIRTEQSDLEYPDWFPEGCRHLDFAGRLIDDSARGRRDALREVLRSLAPQQIFNVNSRLMWDSTHALHKVLTDQSRLFAYLFCSDINDQGVEAGYPVEFFYRAISECTGVITDSIALADTLRARFRLPPDHPHLHTLATPLISPVAPVHFDGTPKDRHPRIYWAGRFDTQKRVDLLFEIAARMPHADFFVWGKPVLDTGLGTALPPANVALHGTYARFDELPLGNCDAWLYTSAWDGVPTLLMDVAAAGIPLVGSLVGGTGEVMAKGFSERLEPGTEAAAYVAALDRVLADLPGARARAAELSARVTAERSFDTYRDSLRRILQGTGVADG